MAQNLPQPITTTVFDAPILTLASILFGALVASSGADLPVVRLKFSDLAKAPELISRSAGFHSIFLTTTNLYTVLQGTFVCLVIVFVVDFFTLRKGFRTLGDIVPLVVLGVFVKQEFDYVMPAQFVFREPGTLAFAMDPMSKLFDAQREEIVEAIVSIAIGRSAQLGCLLIFILVKLYTALGGRYFVNMELRRLDKAARRAAGEFVPENEIERLREELRREALQGDEITIRPVGRDGKVMSEADVLAGKAGERVREEAMAVVERRKRKELEERKKVEGEKGGKKDE